MWIADSSATYHVNGGPTLMFGSKPPTVREGTLLVSDMMSMEVKYFGKLSMVMRSTGRELDLVLLNVAYAPVFKSHLFSLHEDTPKSSAMMDAAGVHLIGGRLTFARGVSGSYVKAPGVKPDSIIAASVLSPGKMQRINKNDFHAALAHSHEVTFRVTARQLSVKVSGELVPSVGCFEAEGRRMAVPWSTECRSTKPLERVFVDRSGKRPPSASGPFFLMMIVDDFSRLGWPYFLKKSDAAFVFAKFLDIRADGCPSVLECIRSDNGTEFLSTEFVAMLNNHGIHCEYTSVAFPKHDGVVE